MLTSDHIESIKQSADKLEGWVGNLSYGTCPAKNFLVELTLSFYPYDLDTTVSLLGSIPKRGRQVRRDFEELCLMIQKVDAWNSHGVYKEEMDDFIALINRLRKTALGIVSVLREISADQKTTASEQAPVKPEIRKANPVNPSRKGPTARRPDEVAFMAYKLYGMGLNELQVAKRMTSELKMDKPIRGWAVSRWIKQVENWHTHTGLYS